MPEIYDVYFDSGSGMELVGEGLSETSLTVLFGPFEYGTTYSWRVDATNEYGTTEGDVWSFTCLSFKPPLPTGITLDSEGNPTGTASGDNTMITIRRLVAAANNKIWIEDVS